MLAWAAARTALVPSEYLSNLTAAVETDWRFASVEAGITDPSDVLAVVPAFGSTVDRRLQCFALATARRATLVVKKKA